MDVLFIILLIIIVFILTVCFVNYVFTLPQRRKHKELIKREELLFTEKYKAEKAKQYSRIAGQITREKIDKLANLK